MKLERPKGYGTGLRLMALWLCGGLFCAGLSAGVVAQTSSTAQVVAVDSIEAAVKLRRQGKVAESIEMLLRLKTIDRNNVRVNLELVMGYLQSRQYCRADEVVEYIFTLAPAMKENIKLKQLDAMIDRARKNAERQSMLVQGDEQEPSYQVDSHKFNAEVTMYKGFEELTSEFSYLEITEFEDYFKIELKNDQLTSKYYYSAARFKGEYRYTPSDSFTLFDRPTYWFVSNRMTYFYKQADTLADVHFGYSSLDSSWYVIQPEFWAFNASLKGKWHNYQGQHSLTELKADMNLSTLFHGARIKLGISRNDHTLDMSYAEDSIDENYYVYEQKSYVITPYIGVSYRFSPDFLWSVVAGRDNIHSANYLLEGWVNKFNTTLKYDVNENIELHLSYANSDLRYDYYNVDGCFDLEAFECLNSGESKQTVTFGSGYYITPHWQVGINAMYMDKKQDNKFGRDQWKRLEAFVKYRF